MKKMKKINQVQNSICHQNPSVQVLILKFGPSWPISPSPTRQCIITRCYSSLCSAALLLCCQLLNSFMLISESCAVLRYPFKSLVPADMCGEAGTYFQIWALMFPFHPLSHVGEISKLSCRYKCENYNQLRAVGQQYNFGRSQSPNTSFLQKRPYSSVSTGASSGCI